MRWLRRVDPLPPHEPVSVVLREIDDRLAEVRVLVRRLAASAEALNDDAKRRHDAGDD